MKKVILFLITVAALAFAAQANEAPASGQQTAAPVFNGFSEEGVEGYNVMIVETEPDCTIYFRVQYPYPDGEWSEWMEYTETLKFSEPGRYRVESYAVVDGKTPSADIAYEFMVQERTSYPVYNGHTVDGIQAYYVEIVETEPSTIYYRVQSPDQTWSEWMEYEGMLKYTQLGHYRIESYAIADGKSPSETIAYEFVVTPLTAAPVFNGYSEEGVLGYNVMIIETEPDCNIYYRVMYPFPDGEWTEWDEYTEMLTFTEPGRYRLEAYAVADGKSPSAQIAFEFMVQEQTDLPVIMYTENINYGGGYVDIIEPEPDCDIYYRFQGPNSDMSDWMHYDGMSIPFTEHGYHSVQAYAVAPDKLPSETVQLTFLVRQQTSAPVFNGYSEEGVQGYNVAIVATEPNCTLYFRVSYPFPDGEWSDWIEYPGLLTYTEPGRYRVEAYAVADGKKPSAQIAFEFVVQEQTDKPVIVYTENNNYGGGYVEIIEPEPDCDIYYRIQGPNSDWSDWMHYDGQPIAFSEPGEYQIEAYAVAPDKSPSETVQLTFLVRQRTSAPVFNGYSEEGVQGYNVAIVATEPNCTLYFRVSYPFPDGEWTEWMEYTDMLTFTDPGKYRLEAYAVANGKKPSAQIAFEFVVEPLTTQPGDVNGDGDVSIADVTELIDILLSGDTSNPRCDVNGDGDISIADVTELIDYLLTQ